MTEQKAPSSNKGQNPKPQGQEGSSDWLEGRKLGKYKLVKRIGAGSFASIYEAVHVHLQVPFAIKILHPAFAGHDEIVKRFFREAQAASQLQHENVVFIADFDVAEGIGPYIVMEFLEGGTLKAYLEENKTPPLEEVGEISRQICQALTLAHRKGIIHRDLKPENVFLIRRDMGHLMVKILDFGIAHLSAARDSITGAKLMGTPVYMAPEQFRGQVNSESLDIYSFGVILYEMLVGQPPFQGQSVQRLGIEHLLLPAPELNESFPQGLRQLQARLLGKTPDERPASMEETWSLLATALDPNNQHPHWHQSNLLPNTIMPLPSSDTVIARMPGYGGVEKERATEQNEALTNTSIEPAPHSEEIEVSVNTNSTDNLENFDADSLEMADDLERAEELTSVSMPPLAPASTDEDEATVLYRVEPTATSTPPPPSKFDSDHKESEVPTLQPTPGLQAPEDMSDLVTVGQNENQAEDPETIELLDEESPLQRVVLDESESSLAGQLNIKDLDVEGEALELSEGLNLETHKVVDDSVGEPEDPDKTAPGTLSPPVLVDVLDEMDKTVPGRLAPPTLAPESKTIPAEMYASAEHITQPDPSMLTDTASKLPPPPVITPDMAQTSESQVDMSAALMTGDALDSNDRTVPGTIQPIQTTQPTPISSPPFEEPLPSAPTTSPSIEAVTTVSKPPTAPPGYVPPTPIAPPTSPSAAPGIAPPTLPSATPGIPVTVPPTSPNVIVAPMTAPSPEHALFPQEKITATRKVPRSRLQNLIRMSRREKRLLLIVWFGVLIAIGSLWYLIAAEMSHTKAPPPQRRAKQGANFQMSVVRRAPKKQRLQKVGIMTVPSGAVVYINGKNLGKSPLNIPLEVGKEVRLRFRMDGYEDGIIVHKVQQLKTGSDSVLYNLRKVPQELP